MRINGVMSPHGRRETKPFASEVTFIIDQPTGIAVRDRVRTQMEADPHGAGHTRRPVCISPPT
jgi:hypothetical protein